MYSLCEQTALSPICQWFNNINYSKSFHGDTTEHIDGKATLKSLLASIFRYLNCNCILFNIKSNKLLPLKYKHILFLLLTSNMILIDIDTTIDNVVF